MALYHLLSGKKKMCLLQQWFNYSFCNRGHGCRKVLFASSIHRKEVWVFQFMIFILTGIFHPFSLPACIMHELSLVSVLLCMSLDCTGSHFWFDFSRCRNKYWCSYGKTWLDLILQLFCGFWYGQREISCLNVACFQYWCGFITSSWRF